jgi:hypothetical protein
MDTLMGQLKPGVSYVYERQGGIVYAREHGADAASRQAIGWDWEPESNPARIRGASPDSINENHLWYQIREASLTNPQLHRALEQCKVLYYLSLNNGEA